MDTIIDLVYGAVALATPYSLINIGVQIPELAMNGGTFQ